MSHEVACPLLGNERILRSPSVADGITRCAEVRYRILGCDLISQAGAMLEVPQAVTATAQTLLHRFYHRVSLAEVDAFEAAMACTFVAIKVEEQAISFVHVVNVFHRILQLRTGRAPAPLLRSGDWYARWKDRLLSAERRVLRELGFALYSLMDHPHRYLLYFFLKGSRALGQRAWSCLNDSLLLDLCVRRDAQTIAAAAIDLAARDLNEPLPADPHWCRVLGVEESAMVEVAHEIAAVALRPEDAWLPSLSQPGMVAALARAGDAAAGARIEWDMSAEPAHYELDAPPAAAAPVQPSQGLLFAAAPVPAISLAQFAAPGERSRRGTQ